MNIQRYQARTFEPGSAGQLKIAEPEIGAVVPPLLENEVSLKNANDRPLLHFTPPHGWMNDPNGLVFDEQKRCYHMFYQYHPKDCYWGPMHWGHATSFDLIDWQHQPIAIAPQNGREGMAFSGSVVIDENNSSGLQTTENPVFVAIFTEADDGLNQRQSLAVSNDRGFTWERYKGNPVIPNNERTDFRDPKVFRHQPSDRWIMVVATGCKSSLFSSKDLIDWRFESDFAMPALHGSGVWECPDLFPLPAPDHDGFKWVFLTSLLAEGSDDGDIGGCYWLGSFNGHEFIPDPEFARPRILDHGEDCYAFTTYSNLPEIGIAWMNNWRYASRLPEIDGTRGSMTIPRRLAVVAGKDGNYLSQSPVLSLGAGRPVLKLSDISYQQFNHELLRLKNFSFIIKVTFGFKNESPSYPLFGLTLSAAGKVVARIDVNVYAKEIVLDRMPGGFPFNETEESLLRAPLFDIDDTVTLEIIIDKNSIEVFANGGKSALTTLISPSPSPWCLEINPGDQATAINEVVVY